MSTKRFVPELHDIGKIILDIEKYKQIAKNKKLCIKGHTILPTDKKYFEQSPSWLGQFHHKISGATIDKWVEKIKEIVNIEENCITTENIHDLFVLLLADGAAATISRVVEKSVSEESESKQKGIYKLWKGDCDIDKSKEYTLCDLIDEINNCNDGNEFLDKYKSILQTIPEDKDYRRRVTTLYTHLELVGKIYNIFKESTCIKGTPSTGMVVEYKGVKDKISDAEHIKHIDHAKHNWLITLALCKINFTHFFVRYHDIFLLKRRQELMDDIKNNKYKNNIMFTTSDSLLLFLPSKSNNNSVYSDIFKSLLDNGFYIEVEESTRPISYEKSKSDCRKQYFIYHSDIEKSLEIEPPICEVCQLRRAEKEPYLKDSIKEWLCDKCKNIRESSKSLITYDTWEKEGISNVCWFKFSIYPSKLEQWIQYAYKEYLKHRNLKLDNEEEFRPLALQVDFNNDYNSMLKKFWEKIQSIERESIVRPIEDYYELGLSKYSPILLREIIKTYICVFKEYFPKCASDDKSPINLSLFIGSIKYPIREYWRYLDSKENKSFLNIKKQNVLEELYTLEEVDKIMEIVNSSNIPSSFMHNLVALYDSLKTNVYIELEIFNNRKKYNKLYDIISKTKGLTASKLLALYRLVSKEEEEEMKRRITMGI
ncbi:MAG: hypothetical protein QXM92_02025 [Candidatus Anstonellales archaeon]